MIAPQDDEDTNSTEGEEGTGQTDQEESDETDKSSSGYTFKYGSSHWNFENVVPPAHPTPAPPRPKNIPFYPALNFLQWQNGRLGPTPVPPRPRPKNIPFYPALNFLQRQNGPPRPTPYPQNKGPFGPPYHHHEENGGWRPKYPPHHNCPLRPQIWNSAYVPRPFYSVLNLPLENSRFLNARSLVRSLYSNEGLNSKVVARSFLLNDPFDDFLIPLI